LEINEAIEQGDHNLAEKLSDELSEERKKKEIIDALNRKEYAIKLQKEEERFISKKKPRFNWGFDSKERWERKGNM